MNPINDQQLDLDRIEETIKIATTEATTEELPHGLAALVDDAGPLVAEVRRLRAELAPYEMLAPQQCQAGKHADWLVDSEYAHACPWCQIEELRAEPRPGVRPAVETGA